jgi:hypothetical protein
MLTADKAKFYPVKVQLTCKIYRLFNIRLVILRSADESGDVRKRPPSHSLV